MNRKKIFAISGSTREHSTNASILKVIAARYKESLDVQLYDAIASLPHFNPDLDTDRSSAPAPVKVLRAFIENADGVIICTPEYIFGLPGALKNVIDWMVSTTVLLDKPVAIIVASGLGEKTFESLSLMMNTVGARIGEHARLLIQGNRGKINRAGDVINPEAMESIDKLIRSFQESIPDTFSSEPKEV